MTYGAGCAALPARLLACLLAPPPAGSRRRLAEWEARQRLHLAAQVEILTKELVDKEALLDERVRARAPSRLYRRHACLALPPFLQQDVRKCRRHGKLRAAGHASGAGRWAQCVRVMGWRGIT